MLSLNYKQPSKQNIGTASQIHVVVKKVSLTFTMWTDHEKLVQVNIWNNDVDPQK